MVCSFFSVLSDFDFCVCVFLFHCYRKQRVEGPGFKPRRLLRATPKNTFCSSCCSRRVCVSVLKGLAPLHMVACVIYNSFLKQERIVLNFLWDSLKHMSAQIADRIAPGPLAGEKKPKSAKKQQRAANNKLLKGQLKNALEQRGMAGKGTSVAGVDNRLAFAMDRIKDAARIDMQYLLQLLDLSSVADSDLCGIPDLTTEIPTGVIRVKNVGTITTDGSGNAAIQLFPTARGFGNVQAGTCNIGTVVAPDGAGTRSIFQYNSFVSSYQGIRLVAMQCVIRAITNITTMAGSIAVAPMPGQTALPLISVASLQAVPMCTNGTIAQVFANGEKAFSWLPAGADRRGVGDPSDSDYFPLEFCKIDRTADGTIMPSLNICVAGAPLTSAILQLEVTQLFEFTTVNVTVPTNAVTPSSAEAVALGKMAQHPTLRSHAESRVGKNTVGSVANHMLSNWDTYKRLGSGAYRTLLHASGMGAQLLGSAAKYAPAAAALLI